MQPATRKRGWNSSAFAQQSKFDAGVEEPLQHAGEIPISEEKEAVHALEASKIKRSSKTSTKENPNWIDTFEPKTTEEVAVHPKKLTELQNWFLHCEAVRKQHPAQICLITGPSGSGKTAAVRVLAQALNYEVQEWINPVDRDTINALGDQSTSYSGSQIEIFKSFLFRSSRYKSLIGSPQKRLVLVEDYPNVIISNAEIFEDILADYIKYGKSPLVFIVTDSKSRSLNISYNVFTEQLKNKFHINHISFNSIALTLLQKAMKRFCAHMKERHIADSYAVPPQSVIDSIVFAAQGDIRNALISLHFASLKGTGTMPIELVKSDDSKSGKSNKKKLSTLKTVRRDESLTMMHALGRVFNPKRLSNGNFTHAPEDISESFSSEPKRFIDLMHANYLGHFSEIEHILTAANVLSITDNILSEYREDVLAPLALNIAVRGIMVSNEKPVSAWMPIRAAQRPIIFNKANSNLSGIPVNLYATDYESYVKVITGSITK